MDPKKGKLFLEIHNKTRLLLFANVRYGIANKKPVAILHIFDRPPRHSTLNDENLYKLFPEQNFRWCIDGASRWVMNNKTRYNPLKYETKIVKTKEKQTFQVEISPTNNHITEEDLKLIKDYQISSS